MNVKGGGFDIAELSVFWFWDVEQAKEPKLKLVMNTIQRDVFVPVLSWYLVDTYGHDNSVYTVVPCASMVANDTHLCLD